jgi:hypothetical protein
MFANSTELVKFVSVILTDLMRFVAEKQHPNHAREHGQDLPDRAEWRGGGD